MIEPQRDKENFNQAPGYPQSLPPGQTPVDNPSVSDQAPWSIRQTFTGVFLTLVPWIAFALLLNSLGGGKTSSSVPLSPEQDLAAAIISLIFSTIVEGAFLIAPFYYANAAVRWITPHAKLALSALGFRKFSAGRTFFWIVILILAILAVNNIYQYLITAFHLNLQTNDQVLLAESKKAPLTTYATLLVAVFIAPFCEEIFFRGFVFQGLRRGMPIGWAIVFSALLFGVAHADPGSFAVLFIIGIALAFLRWRTKSIWPGMILHMLNNGIGALVIILYMQGILH
ncbi:MAG TPA: type II CAAX endopeptidase family protein [Ktedonobacteraceae bacterium]|nr:type II CAAX endopeptidase family protein [Ktedonobacteraceae bacterium]